MSLVANPAGTAASAPDGMVSATGFYGSDTSKPSRHPSGLAGTTNTDPAKFPNGIVGGETSGDTDAATTGTVTQTATSKRQLSFTGLFTADRLVLLPPSGSGVLKGETFRFDLTNSGAAGSGFVLTVQAGNGTDIGTISGDNIISSGYIIARALQDNPTTGTHWEIAEVEELRTSTANWTFQSGNTTAPTSLIRLYRRNKMVTVQTGTATGQPTAVSSFLETGVILPIRFRPLAAVEAGGGRVRTSAIDSAFCGILQVRTDGSIGFYNYGSAVSNPNSGANKEFTAVAGVGLAGFIQVTFPRI